MSVVISSEGHCLNSSQVHLLGSSTSPTIEKSHSPSGVWGVGPAERTGKPSTRYWPGGRLASCSVCLRRPRNPREINPSLTLLPPDLWASLDRNPFCIRWHVRSNQVCVPGAVGACKSYDL